MKLLNKRFVSLLLVVVMMLSMIPSDAYAASGSEETSENEWSGRSAVFVGDSITAGTGTTKIYYQYLKESLGLESVNAMGVAGSCISAASDYGHGNQPLIDRYQTIPSADLIMVFMGTNDYGHETPLGSIEDQQEGSFYGALNTIIPELVAEHSSSKIVFVTPLHRYGFGTSKILGTKFTYDNIPNGVGATLGDYVEALKAVCGKNSVSVIDLHTECTLDPEDDTVRSNYMPDGLHPNADGHEVIAEIMESHILNYSPVEKAPETETEPEEVTELVYGNKFASSFTQQNRASSRVNQHLKAGTVITLKEPDVFQWACAKTSDENSSDNLGYFPDAGWSDKETAVVEADGWVGFVFKYRDETQSFDLTKPLSEYITIEEPHTHNYEKGTCTSCGAEHPNLVNFAGKVISILGDSISTFAGYIPTADGFNLEHLARYPQDNLVMDVNETWWLQVINELDSKLGINDSWRGSTVSGNASVTSGVSGSLAAMSNLTRIQNLGSNGTPDVILFYGGTNDLAHVSKVGTFDPATAPTMVDLTTKSWDNLADGYVNTLLRLQHYYPEAEIVAMLPTYTATYYPDTKLAQANEVLAGICEHYGVKYVDLRDSGVTSEYLPDGIHPGEEGMDMITESVVDLLVTECKIEAGENVVHSVTHNLMNVKASLAHLKGVSNGESFVETLTSDEEIVVSVKMDGVDITEQCYSNRTITIGNVTGALEITAKAMFSLAGRLQQLPDEYHGVNLWSILRHDDDYYSADGWVIYSSGKVKSVTIPVIEGERVYASSFEAAGTNGSSTSGIRVTFFDENGVLISMTANEVYAEFKENGFITIPDNAVAVSIPMWTDSNEWKLFITDNSAIPGSLLTEHLQKLPENVCSGVNIWNTLKPESVYYNGTKWGSVANVYSVTFPVSSGEKISSTSFKGIGENGSNAQDGIRVTYFDEKGVLKSLTPAQTYSEFSTNGYLTVPEGAVAVNIPMWTNSADNELYILNLDHNYENGNCCGCGIAQPAPVITKQPTDSEAAMGEEFCVTVEAEGEGLKYQWYFRNKGSDKWSKSGVRDNSYDDVMTKARAGREVYCVITDSAGNRVTTEVAKLIAVPKVELKLLAPVVDAEAAMGEEFCVTVEAEGEGLKYQWYYRNAGSEKWYKSGVRDNTYDDVMTKARAGREVYCVITDAYGNTITTEIVKLIAVPKVALKLLTPVTDGKAAMGENFCVTVEAEGEGLKYHWYYRNAGSEKWYKSGVRDNTYDDVMTKARVGREVYCVVSDAWGNSVTTNIATLVGVPSETLAITTQPTDAEAKLGEKYCVTVDAEGDGISYQWYFKNAGSKKWSKSSVRDNTYDDVMTKTRAGREVYCVITDAWGNSVTTDSVTLVKITEDNK